MTVSTLDSVAEFVTNGVTTNFPFFFKFLANEDLVVTYVDQLGAVTILTLGTHYTANGAGNDAGGSIVTTTALAGPGQLVVSREMDAYQETSLRNQGKFLAETHENVFDRLTMLIQQGFSIFTRALVRPLGKPYYDAENRNISHVADPVEMQDASTKHYTQQYVGDVISQIQGPINNAANVFYLGPDGIPRVVQDLSSGIGADMVGFSRSAIDRAIRTIGQALSGNRINIWEYAHLATGYVAGGNPSTWDWAPAINAASALIGARRVQVYFPEIPGGWYRIRAQSSMVGAGGARNYALNLPSGLDFQGDYRKTIIKMADNESTDAAVRDINIFMTNAAIKNIRLDGIIFDLNGANNKISPNRGTGVWGRQACAAINITGNSAWVDGASITNCQFNNTPGTSQIVLAQSENGFAGPLSKNVVMAYNEFHDNGQDTDDHSCVFAWAENVTAVFNKFEQSTSLSRAGKNWVPFELHGKNTWFCQNEVLNFFRGCWIASNFSKDAKNLHVLSNVFEVWGSGPSLFRELGTLSPLYDVHILNNDITITVAPDMLLPSLIKCGIELVQPYDIFNVFVRGNIIRCQDTSRITCAMNVSAKLPGRTHSNIFFEDNYAVGTTNGFYARVNNGEGILDKIYERRNTYENLNTALAEITFGSIFSQSGSSTIGVIESTNNNYKATSGVTSFKWGMFLSGVISDAHIDNNTFINMVNYSAGRLSINNSATIVTRRGRDICTGSTYPASGSWVAGDEFYNPAPTTRKNIAYWKYDGSGWHAFGAGAGPTTERPALADGDKGYLYYDTTISKLMYWSGSAYL